MAKREKYTFLVLYYDDHSSVWDWDKEHWIAATKKTNASIAVYASSYDNAQNKALLRAREHGSVRLLLHWSGPLPTPPMLQVVAEEEEDIPMEWLDG